jgi:tetratricopeptide (TPR) repeat protein
MKAELIEHIEDFLDGRITRAALEEKADMLGTEDLEENIQWVEDSRTAVEAAGLREQLNEILPATRKAKVISLRSLRPVLAVAASVLLLVVAYFGLRGGENSRLYKQYAYVDPGLPVLMSQSEDYLLYNALTYYNEENYEVAIEELTKIKDQYAGNDTLSYFLAASLLYEGRTEEARTLFDEVVLQGNSGFKERAEWLQILCAVKEKDIAAGKVLLEQVLNNPEHEFYQKALALQNDWIE